MDDPAVGKTNAERIAERESVDAVGAVGERVLDPVFELREAVRNLSGRPKTIAPWIEWEDERDVASALRLRIDHAEHRHDAPRAEQLGPGAALVVPAESRHGFVPRGEAKRTDRAECGDGRAFDRGGNPGPDDPTREPDR
jgi:hypothetical protein